MAEPESGFGLGENSSSGFGWGGFTDSSEGIGGQLGNATGDWVKGETGEVWGYPCLIWRNPQGTLFQIANVCFLIAYASPNGKYGQLFLHAMLVIAFLIFSTWAWNVICSADIFFWNFTFMLINMGQTMVLLYKIRHEVKIPLEFEEIYRTIFGPLKVSRILFKKMVSDEYAQVNTLHAGEAYAMQNLTKTDRLGLLISGKINVMTDQHFLHHIFPKQFIDSPEFESTKTGLDDKFKVSILAASPCRYIFWYRENLEYLLIKEQHLATVIALVVARDITNKLYAMNEKIVTEKGSHLDIRLPSITSSMTSHSGTDPDWRSPCQSLGSKSLQCNNVYGQISMSPNSIFKSANDSLFGSKERLMEVLETDSPSITIIKPEDNIIQ